MSQVSIVLLMALAVFLVVVGTTVRVRARRALFDLGVLLAEAESRVDQARSPDDLRRLLDRAHGEYRQAQLIMAAGHPSIALARAQALSFNLTVALEEQGFKMPF